MQGAGAGPTSKRDHSLHALCQSLEPCLGFSVTTPPWATRSWSP